MKKSKLSEAQIMMILLSMFNRVTVKELAELLQIQLGRLTIVLILI